MRLYTAFKIDMIIAKMMTGDTAIFYIQCVGGGQGVGGGGGGYPCHMSNLRDIHVRCHLNSHVQSSLKSVECSM